MDNKEVRRRLPDYLRRPIGSLGRLHELKKVLRSRNLHTVCESARCPNIGECFSKPTATFMILGNACTRHCAFCGVDNKALPYKVDIDEPRNVAITAREMKLKHVVVTSVTRDDLTDGGATQFARTIKAIREELPEAFIEVLTPDFKGDVTALELVINEGPDIFNHNVETVKRLYSTIRPEARYETSLRVLSRVKAMGAFTKSGFMVGLGETKAEVEELINDLVYAGCDAITIGQYLRPTKNNAEVVEYVPEEVFSEYAEFARSKGIRHAYAGPFVRSSYNAEDIFTGL